MNESNWVNKDSKLLSKIKKITKNKKNGKYMREYELVLTVKHEPKLLGMKVTEK